MIRFTKRTKFLSSVVVFSLLGLVYIGLSIKPNASKNNTAPLPKIPVPESSVAPVKFELSKNLKFEIPKYLKIYSIENSSLSSGQMDQIAIALGFTGKSDFINDPIYGPTSLWTTDEKSLIIKSRDRTISYSVNGNNLNAPTGFRLNSEEILTKVNDYLAKLPIPKFTFKTQNVYYFTANDSDSTSAVSASQASFAKVTFSYYIDNLPLVTNFLTDSSPSITIEHRGEPYSFDLAFPPTLGDSIERQTLSSTELKEKLPDAKLISFTNLNRDEPLSDYFDGKATITNIYIAYYQYLQQTTLQPVFIIQAEGKTKLGRNATATFLLPALK